MSTGGMNVQWFPGHMAKAKRRIEQSFPLCDALVAVLDARVPRSSGNLGIDFNVNGKTVIYALNKCDLADDGATRSWLDFFENEGLTAFAIDSRSGSGVGKVVTELKRISAEKMKRRKFNGAFRVMAAGIPNVGKSTFINRLCGRNSAKTENRPGVTRGNQWFSLSGEIEMLDTPGVLSPKFNDKSTGEHLAFIGSVKDSVTDGEALAYRLAECLTEVGYAELLLERYGIRESVADAEEFINAVAEKRCGLRRGGEADIGRACVMLLNDFRAGKIGKITLERPKNAG